MMKYSRSVAFLTALGGVRSLASTASAAAAVGGSNPLLDAHALWPDFSTIKAEHVEPGLRSMLASELEALEKLESTTGVAGTTPSWSEVAVPLEHMMDRLTRTWGAISHLAAVNDHAELRSAVETMMPEVVQFSTRVSQSAALYRAFKAMQDDPAAWALLTEAQRSVVEAQVRDAELAGVGLDGESKARFGEIQQELSSLQQNFSNHVLDATKAFSLIVSDAAELDGLPLSARELAANSAVTAGHVNATAESGPWALTLDGPSFTATMKHARKRELREEVYRAYITRASTGDADNLPLIVRILALRNEMAQLLGFAHYADLSLASKTADLGSATALLEQLLGAARSEAQREHTELEAFAAQSSGGDLMQLKQWDVAFYAERVLEAEFELEEEALRPFFPLENVLDGLFTLCSRLFGVRVVAADGDAPIWHPDVRYFKILPLTGGDDAEPLAHIYLDPYSRPATKRGGAWMGEVVGRSAAMADFDFDSATAAAATTTATRVRLPVAHMVCNGSPPAGGKPSLMTFREVETLFHEAGHALQHVLSTVDEGFCAGIRNIAWDAVEVPSQFMENFVYDKKTLLSFARHHETNESLPLVEFEKLKAARTYRSASALLRQVHLASVDLQLHSVTGAADDLEAAAATEDTTAFKLDEAGVLELERRVAENASVLAPLPEDRFLCGFSHIFAGGYAAGYYSYKWAEVAAADAFAAFEEVGLENEVEVAATGRRFRDTILGMGGSRSANDVFRDFRGRDAEIDALLRHAGLGEQCRSSSGGGSDE